MKNHILLIKIALGDQALSQVNLRGKDILEQIRRIHCHIRVPLRFVSANSVMDDWWRTSSCLAVMIVRWRITVPSLPKARR